MNGRNASGLRDAKRFERYRDALLNIPHSGGGGCHTALLAIANLGRLTGFDCERIACDLAAHVHGTRKVTKTEITAAVSKAFDSPSVKATRFNIRVEAPRAVDGTKLLDAIVDRGAAFTEPDLWEASPVRIDWEPKHDAVELLRRLYAPEDRVFMGTRHDSGADQILTVSEWTKCFSGGVAIPEHVIPNPLSGQTGQTKDGKLSYRADSCVEQFKFAVVEFDAIPREKQIRFWAGVKMPVVALLDSGGKSVHGWVRIDAANADEWEQRAERRLFELLTAVGADRACKNEARLSRMPGHFRSANNRWQRLLYLDPIGAPVIP